jgi:hypothetical protein
MSKESRLPEHLTLLIPRGEAQALLREAIAEGKALLRRRSSADLRANTPQAREVVSALKVWAAQSSEVMSTCFGEAGRAAVRSTSLRYTTLEVAKGRVRLRIDLLNEALERAGQLRKTTGASAPATKPKVPEKRESAKKPTLAASTRSPAVKTERAYDFCLSFAGEDRKYARRLKELLERRGARVFYDEAEKHKLWGKDLFVRLDEIYQHEAHYCVMFTSQTYVQKAWTNHERQSAQARSLQQQDYILPIRLDDTDIPGLRPSKGHMDVRKDTLPIIADTAMRILRDEHPARKGTPAPSKARTGRQPKKPGAAAEARGRKPSLVLLGEHFYREVRYKESGDVVTVHVEPRDAAEESRLRQLGDQTRGGLGGGLAFANRFSGGRAQVQNVEHLGERGKPLTVVSLRLESAPGQRSYVGQDVQASIERHARWILFGETPPQHERYTMARYDAQTEPLLSAGVVKKLWEGWQGSQAEFRAAAQLLLVYHLRHLGVLDHITALNVGPWQGRVLPLQLKGTRQSALFGNQVHIEAVGQLELPAKLPRR